MKSNTNKLKCNALKISNDTYNKVFERDNGCILCLNYELSDELVNNIIENKSNLLECHHFIPRSRLGMGIEQNLVMLCSYHHRNVNHSEFQEQIKEYLKSKYSGWSEKDLVFRKE